MTWSLTLTVKLRPQFSTRHPLPPDIPFKFKEPSGYFSAKAFLKKPRRRSASHHSLLKNSKIPSKKKLLRSMAEDAERTFARTFLNMLSTQSITYSDDYQQPPELSLRRVPVLPVSSSLTPFLWLLYAINIKP